MAAFLFNMGIVSFSANVLGELWAVNAPPSSVFAGLLVQSYCPAHMRIGKSIFSSLNTASVASQVCF